MYACVKGRRWPGLDRTCKYKLFAISTRFTWLDLRKILPFFTFISPAAYNFVSQTSLLRETNRTWSIMAFQSASSTASRAKRSVPSNSIHPTNFTLFNSTKRRHTSQGNSVNIERNSITVKAKFFPLRNQATLLKVAGIVGLQPKQEL